MCFRAQLLGLAYALPLAKLDSKISRLNGGWGELFMAGRRKIGTWHFFASVVSSVVFEMRLCSTLVH